MHIGCAVKESKQVMSIHLTGNSCHAYGRAYIRTQLKGIPQFPMKNKQDLDNYICQVDIMILMMFSNFYKQRILPSEIHDFFVKNERKVGEMNIEANLDYLKIKESPELEELNNVRILKNIF